MSFSGQDAKEWVTKNKWWVALLVVVIFGYTFGKDIAFRDNEADATEAGEAR